MKLTPVSRRDFLKAGAVLGGGLVIGVAFSQKAHAFPGREAAAMADMNAFLKIGEDNTIRVLLSKIEMGQGISTTLAILIAEELDCDWKDIRVEQMPQYRGSKIREHIFVITTGGSDTTRSEFDRYRTAGATARVLLVNAAAKRFGVDPTGCTTQNGRVLAGSKSITYGELAGEASRLEVPQVKLRDHSEWKLIGRSKKRVDSPGKINGQAKYGIDIQLPGLLTAVICYPPVFGAKVRSFNAAKAKAIKGIHEVVTIPAGIAIVADNYWLARLGRDALEVNWDIQNSGLTSTISQLGDYKRLAHTPGKVSQEKGDALNALNKAGKIMEAEFSFPYLSHSPMETLNCTVKISKGACEVWVGTQSPALRHEEVANFLGFKPEQVIINTPCLGGSFGRRGSLSGDWVMDAVHTAKASGKFIKLMWSREDDIRGGGYRPAYVHSARIRIGSDGLPAAWHHRIVGQSIFVNTPLEEYIVSNGIDHSSVDGLNGSPYLETIAHHRIELHTTACEVPVLAWRAVGNTHTAFVMETLIDELAAIAGKDPVAYRRTLLSHRPRHIAVLDMAAAKSGWGMPLPAGHFRGIAIHEAMGSVVCQVVELSLADKRIVLHRVVCAIDCGLAVNPEGVKAQMESGIVFGLTAALYGEVTLENGRVKQSNFHDYKVMRINEMPLIEVHILPGQGKMGGAGEPGVPPAAPALTNALFAATGKRIRDLPIRIDQLI